jgi:ATP-dependent Clp protease adaptor protein ClpS
MSPPPTRYQIRFLNDDLTPMEFVFGVLEDVFKMTREQATEAMLATHRRGTYVVATMDKAEAEEAARLIRERATQLGHPFRCVVEAEPPPHQAG